MNLKEKLQSIFMRLTIVHINKKNILSDSGCFNDSLRLVKNNVELREWWIFVAGYNNRWILLNYFC